LPTRLPVLVDQTAPGADATQVVRPRTVMTPLPTVEPAPTVAPRALGVGAFAAAVVAVVAAAFVATRPDPPVVAALVPAPVVVDAPVAAPPVVVAPTEPVEAGVEDAADVDVVAIHRPGPRKPAPVVIALPARPERLGERVAYLKQHCARLPCTSSIQARATNIARAPAEQIMTMRKDVDACLDRCGAPP
jgi:hypothetical protein